MSTTPANSADSPRQMETQAATADPLSTPGRAWYRRPIVVAPLILVIVAAMTLVIVAFTGLVGGDGGGGEDEAAAEAIKTQLAEDPGLIPGLSMGGIVVAVHDSAISYFGTPGLRAGEIQVDKVTLSDADKTADATVTFDLIDQGVTCVGGALAMREGEVWDLSALTVTSCR